MRTFVLFVLLFFSSSVPAYSQVPFASEADLIGDWKLDVQKTRQLWKERGLEEYTSALKMLPTARKLGFSKKQLLFADSNIRVDYSVQDFNKEAKLLKLIMNRSESATDAQVKTVDEDTIVIDWPWSAVGPVSVVYSRTPPRTAIEYSDPLEEIAGEWHLDPEATRRMWKSQAVASAYENFLEFGEPAIKDAKRISISGTEIQFSDQSFAPWRLKRFDGSICILDNQYYQPCYEIHVVAKDVIQVLDSDRYLYAIFKRTPDVKLAVAKLPENNLAKRMLKKFVNIAPNERLPRPKRVAANGDISVRSISVSSYRSTNGAKPQAKIEFAAKIPARHYAGRDDYFFTFRSLNDVIDESGAQLKPAIENKASGYPLNASACRGSSVNRDGSMDVSFYLNIPAPPRGTRVKELSGEVELFRMQRRNVRFKIDAEQLEGPLENPLLAGLEIQARIENDRKEFVLKLSQEAKASISSWHLVGANGEKIQSMSKGSGGGEASKGYRDSLPEEAFLVIQLLKLSPVKKSTFKFENIRVP